MNDKRALALTIIITSIAGIALAWASASYDAAVVIGIVVLVVIVVWLAIISLHQPR